MPHVDVDGLTINYDVQGEGEPLLLIPYTSADHACWAFQLPAYTEHFSCIAVDLPGSGESDKPSGPYSTDGQADQVAAFLGAIGIEQAHVAGMSFGAAVGIHMGVEQEARKPGTGRPCQLLKVEWYFLRLLLLVAPFNETVKAGLLIVCKL